MRCLLMIALAVVCMTVTAQEERETLTMQEEIQIENQVSGEEEVDDDALLLAMDDFRKHPLSVNRADAEKLGELRLLTDLQIQQLIRYREMFGKLISIYELQAVPGWDLATINRVRPYITMREPVSVRSNMKDRLHDGASNVLLRSSMVPQLSDGFIKDDSGSSRYTGSRARLFLRYQYNYKNLLQFGVLGDKDAGEAFFRGAQKAGFDFYSYHIFIRKLGAIKALAIGDYTVNMGQGLIHWQGSGLRKNADAMLIKRQGEVLKPYRSAGEYNFQRGIGVSWQKEQWTITGFASYRKYTASLDQDDQGEYVSSIVTSGYHRTVAEQEKRKNLVAISGGAVIRRAIKNGSISLNTIHYKFQLPLRPQPKPYDLFGINGKTWSNYSVDFDYTFKNLHTYGEIAVDYNSNIAYLHGAMLSLHRNVDFSIVYRNLPARYQSMAGGSFTENSSPSNETGLYSGLVIRPRSGWVINMYADVFRSPWVRFTTDAPSNGNGYLLQVIHRPDKKTEIYSRYSTERKSLNVSGATGALPEIQIIQKTEWRFQFSNQFTKALLFRSRISISSWGDVSKTEREKGFLAFTDVICKPQGSVSGNLRLQYYDTDSYNSRIYAYENGPLYDMSIPAFYDQGWRYYVNLSWKAGVGILSVFDTRLYLRYGGVVQGTKPFFGSGLDKINRSSKNDLKFQLMVFF